MNSIQLDNTRSIVGEFSVEFGVDRFQEMDLNVSAYVFSESTQEDKWIQQVTVTLCEKAKYIMVRVLTIL